MTFSSDPCPAAPDAPGHAYWGTMRFRWPWGVPFPNKTRCLYCSAKPPRKRAVHARDVDVTRLGRYGPGRQA